MGRAELLDANGHRKRRTSRRAKTKRKNPAASIRFKALHADPVWRAAFLERNAKVMEWRKANPDKCTRRGVPDGMRKEKAMALWARAEKYAKRLITIMEEAGEFAAPEVTIPGSEEEMAKLALQEAFKIAVGPLTHATTKNAAIRTVLEWTKAKPESRSNLTLNGAESWLASVKEDLKEKKSAATGDGGAS